MDPVKASNKLLSVANKTAQDVVTDYLRVLWNYTLEGIRNYREDFDPDVFSFRLVLTVPAMWSPQAKERTLQAAKDAGIPGKIILVSEPEAAALATLKEKSKEGTLKVGGAFVVCDAGGGTVDLISYEITALDPLQMKECVIGSGDLCGSVHLDQAFQRYICTLIGESQWARIKEGSKKRMMRQFEYGIKRSFTEASKQQYSVELVGVEDDPEHDIYDDTITLTTSALRVVFDIVSLQIENLVSKQIAAITDKKLTVKAVLLVGGFGESRYLLERLRHCHSQEGIRVLQVTGAWSPICRGATLWGLEHSDHTSTLQTPTVTSRLSRSSYGIATDENFDPSKHSGSDTYLDPAEGITLAPDQMNWFLKKGEEVPEGSSRFYDTLEIIQVGFFSTGSRIFQSTIYCCEDDDPPSRRSDSVKPLCTVHYTVNAKKLWRSADSWRSPIDGQKYRDAIFTIAMTVGSSLQFTVFHRNQPVGYASAQYLE